MSSDMSVFQFALSRTNSKKIFENKSVVIFYFDFDEEGNVYIIKSIKSIDHENQKEFVKFMKEFDSDLQIRSSLRTEYKDVTEAFHELMEKP
jgi:hypothetical protein